MLRPTSATYWWKRLAGRGHVGKGKRWQGLCREIGVVRLGGWLGGDVEAILGRK